MKSVNKNYVGKNFIERNFLKLLLAIVIPILFYFAVSGYELFKNGSVNTNTLQPVIASPNFDSTILVKNFINSIFNLPYSDDNSKLWVKQIPAETKEFTSL